MLVPGHKYGSTDDVDGERALYKDLSSRKHLVRVYRERTEIARRQKGQRAQVASQRKTGMDRDTQEEWRRKETQIECRRQQAEFDFMHRKVAE